MNERNLVIQALRHCASGARFPGQCSDCALFFARSEGSVCVDCIDSMLAKAANLLERDVLQEDSEVEGRIYTHDEAALIVEACENALEKYKVKLPSPEDDEREADNECALYGSTYSDLLDTVESILIEVLERHESGARVVPDVFSSEI